MYHLIIENLGVKRCIARSEKDNFKEDMYIDCLQDFGCIPETYIRSIRINCTGKEALSINASIYKD